MFDLCFWKYVERSEGPIFEAYRVVFIPKQTAHAEACLIERRLGELSRIMY